MLKMHLSPGFLVRTIIKIILMKTFTFDAERPPSWFSSWPEGAKGDDGIGVL